ncbi:MFS transporter [Myxococcota bacterium]
MHRFAISYFLLLASVGVYAAWLPPFLEHRGLSPRLIGLALALVMVSRATLPPLWGLLADRTHAKRAIFVSTALLSGSALTALALPGPTSSILVWLFVYGFFLVPVMPLLETLTLEGLGRNRTRYGPIRLWGSLGFIATSFGLAWLFERNNDAGGYTDIDLVPFALGLPLMLAGLSALGMPVANTATSPVRTRLRDLPWGILGPVMLAAMLGQASHGPYYAFFSLELKAQGVDARLIGALWGFGVAAEIVLMALSPRLLPRLGLTRAMRWALVLTIVRWLVLGSVDSLVVIALTQLLHAATYGLLHIATIQLFDQVTPSHSKAFSQAVLSAGAYGVGIGAGLALAGQFVGEIGFSGLCLGAAACGLLGFVASLLISQRRLTAAGG